MFRHPWQWGVVSGLVMGASIGVGDGRRDGVGQGALVGIALGITTALVQGVSTSEKAAGRWTRVSTAGPVMRGCRLLVLLLLAVVVAILLVATFAGPAPTLGWLLIVFLITAISAPTVFYALRR
jgi:drug/metabolite transporter (DMT)-like permease